MSLSPPQPAVPGQSYYLYLNFYDEQAGAYADPSAITLDITYGNATYQYAMDVTGGGPFTYANAVADSANTIWRIGVGQYAFDWSVPPGIANGVYVANWVCTYGPDSDQILVVEDFPLTGGFVTQIPSGDFGYWSGSLTYAPSWSPNPIVIPFGTTDTNGISWIWQSITGWDSAPSVGQVIQRSADHGGWAAAQYAGPRIITLNVMASAPDQPTRDLARALLQQAVPWGTSNNDLATLVYNEPVPKQAQVRRNGGASVTESYPTLCDVMFSIPLVAPDPRKYSTTPQSTQIIIPAPVVNPVTLPVTTPVVFPGGIPPSSVAINVTNSGTFETRPSLAITGPISGPAVVNGTLGQAVSFTNLVMGVNDVLTIDMDARQPFLNNAFYPADPQSVWWTLEPGSSSVYLDGITTGGATLTITWSSAWM